MARTVSVVRCTRKLRARAQRTRHVHVVYAYAIRALNALMQCMLYYTIGQCSTVQAQVDSSGYRTRVYRLPTPRAIFQRQHTGFVSDADEGGSIDLWWNQAGHIALLTLLKSSKMECLI